MSDEDSQEQDYPDPEIAPEGRTSKPAGPVCKVGNLGNDWTLKLSASGTPYATNTLAVTRPVREGDWQGEKITTWYQLVCFQAMAENAQDCLHRGDRVIVSGDGEIETVIDDKGNGRIFRRIAINGMGPDLRYATAMPTKIDRRVLATATGGSEYDDEPF